MPVEKQIEQKKGVMTSFSLWGQFVLKKLQKIKFLDKEKNLNV